MEFKELVAEARNIESSRTVTTATRKQTVDPVFKVELVSYPDIVISKTTPGQTKYLVLMPTQNSYYIKTQPKGSKPAVMDRLNVANLRAFITNLGNLAITDDFWFYRLPSDKYECEQFMDYLDIDGISNRLKDRACSDVYYNRYYNYRDECRELYMKFPALFRHFKADKRFVNFASHASDFTMAIADHYGLDSTRRFFEELFKSLVKESSISGYRIGDRIKKILEYNMDISAFIDYVCYESVTMGYADNMGAFFNDWEDTLRMQLQLYDKVKEKYPQNLPTVHNKLAYMTRLKQEYIETKSFAAQVEKTKAFETKISDWVFIAPKSKDDFIDEATQQANCLASYVSKYARGEDHIVFMRKADAPETSVITIEIDLNGNLHQAYRARNKNCSDEELEVIDRWLEFVSKQI